MPVLRKGTDPSSTNHGATPQPFESAATASSSTLRAHGQPVRSPSPETSLKSSARPANERPRSSSFSGHAGHMRKGVHRADTDAASISSSATQRGLTLSSLMAGRSTPHRSFTTKDSDQPPSPLMASPNMQSTVSLSTAHSKAPRNLYDSNQMRAAIEKFEHAHKVDVRGGEANQTGAFGAGGDDHWQTITVKVLPLWNEDPLNGYIEDLNDLVERHIRRIMERSPSHAIAYLVEHFQELLSSGMLTLSTRLNYLDDDQLLFHLDEVWMSFFNRILPHLEAIFLPFMTNKALQRANLQASTSHIALPPIDVRRLSYIAFRDQVILPHASRLRSLFAEIATFHEGDPTAAGRFNPSRRGSLASTASSGHTPNTSMSRHSLSVDVLQGQREFAGRRMQMMGLIASAQTDDDRQETVEILQQALRGEDVAELGGERMASPSPMSSSDAESIELEVNRRPQRIVT